LHLHFGPAPIPTKCSTYISCPIRLTVNIYGTSNADLFGNLYVLSE